MLYIKTASANFLMIAGISSQLDLKCKLGSEVSPWSRSAMIANQCFWSSNSGADNPCPVRLFSVPYCQGTLEL